MRKVLFVDVASMAEDIKEEFLEQVSEIVDTGAFVQGSWVENFENSFAKLHNLDYVIAVSSGTAANHLSLWALGVGPGDEVILPVNTFIATAWGVSLCGSRPVFVDVREEDFNIDIDDVKRKITPKTKAVIAVHLYGHPAPVGELKEICDDSGIYLVEDCAQAHLAEISGEKVGRFGVTSAFSFYPGKNLGAFGEAGAVATNDPELAEKLRMMRNHGSNEKYYHDLPGHNYRTSEIIALSLSLKLKLLKDWTQRRRMIAKWYSEALSDCPYIYLPQEKEHCYSVYHLYVIRTKDAKDRDPLKDYLLSKSIGVGIHYPIPLHLQKAFSYLGYKRSDFPVAERLAQQILSLPMHPYLEKEDVFYISDIIKQFFSKRKR